MHIHIDQGVSFSKLAKKYQNSKVGKMTFGCILTHCAVWRMHCVNMTGWF